MKNIKKVILLTILTTLISSLSFAATLNSLSKKQLEQAFMDKTAVTIGIERLDDNTVANPFAMYMDKEGKIWAIMEQKPADEPQTDEGVYTIGKDGTLYLQWKHWFHAKKLCARLFETKNAYLALGCDGTFQTAFMKNQIQTGKKF